MILMKLLSAGISAEAAKRMAGETISGLVGAGNAQANALQLGTQDMHVFSTVAASTGAIMQPGTGTGPDPYSISDEVVVVNHGANTLSVYPATGGKIANGAANAAFSVPANKAVFLRYLGSQNWAASLSA